MSLFALTCRLASKPTQLFALILSLGILDQFKYGHLPLWAYSLKVEHVAHNDAVVGSNPAKPN